MVVRLRPLAEIDLVERTSYYVGEAGGGVGERFFDAATEALRAIERSPQAGSPRIGELCGIPGLRVRRVADFPCGWFYFVGSEHVDVVRLLAYAQDLPSILAELEPG